MHGTSALPTPEDDLEAEEFARIEAEERAKFAQEHGMDVPPQPSGSRFDDDVDHERGTQRTMDLMAKLSECLATRGDVPLETIARRFLFLGAVAFGGPPAHVALMQVQSWRTEVLDLSLIHI